MEDTSSFSFLCKTTSNSSPSLQISISLLFTPHVSRKTFINMTDVSLNAAATNTITWPLVPLLFYPHLLETVNVVGSEEAVDVN